MLLVSSILNSSARALIWRARATKSNRLLFQLVPLAHPTAATASGLLPTLSTMDGMPPKTPQALAKERMVTRPGRKQLCNLRDVAANGLLPTLTVKGNYNRKELSPKAGDGLATAMRNFLPTLTANEHKGSGTDRYIGSPQYRGAKTAEALRTKATDPIYLSPSFAEEFMGYPIGFTELSASETALFHKSLSKSSDLSLKRSKKI